MTPDWVWLTFITMTGACVGSFLNVVIYRMPEGLSLVHPPSRCPACEKKLAFYDNVPVLGWLWLGGRCRYCKAKISTQYPLIELLTALLFGGTFVLFYLTGPIGDLATGWRPPMSGHGFTQTWPQFVVLLVMLAGLLAATLIDARHYIIPLGIPWWITLVALVGLPAGAYFGLPPNVDLGRLLVYEPFVPMVHETGALVAWGGTAGLVFAVILLRLGVIPDSFEGEDDGELDENGEFPPLKHPRRVALKELMFFGFPLLGMLVGYDLAGHGVIAQPALGSAPWYYVLAGCVLGYLVGGGVIWLIRILGTLGFGKEAMGLGDVHLMAAIGAVLGWHESVYICIFIAPFMALAGTAVTAGVAAMAKGQARVIPYGPWLAGGAVLMLLLGVDRLDLVGIYSAFGSNLPFVP